MEPLAILGMMLCLLVVAGGIAALLVKGEDQYWFMGIVLVGVLLVLIVQLWQNNAGQPAPREPLGEIYGAMLL